MNAKDGDIEEFKTWVAQAQQKNAPFCSHENAAKILHLLQYQEIKIRDKYSSAVPEPEELDVEAVRQMRRGVSRLQSRRRRESLPLPS